MRFNDSGDISCNDSTLLRLLTESDLVRHNDKQSVMKRHILFLCWDPFHNNGII